ncbi:hypothetical protein CTA2_5646, partial [Colletotrichum tanaceti]
LAPPGRLQGEKCLLDTAPIIVNTFHESLRGAQNMNND